MRGIPRGERGRGEKEKVKGQMMNRIGVWMGAVVLAGVMIAPAVSARQDDAKKQDDSSMKQDDAAKKPDTPTVKYSAADLAATAPKANPADVASPEAIVAACYDVISGPAGTRDWNRFLSLFLPTAHLQAPTMGKDGVQYIFDVTPADYERLAGASFAKEGFFENSVVNRVDKFGKMAQVYSSYESRKAKGEKPFARGINSWQLINDGTRWWVVSIAWDEEQGDLKLPKDMEKGGK
jgi:hypothetical protein